MNVANDPQEGKDGWFIAKYLRVSIVYCKILKST